MRSNNMPHRRLLHPQALQNLCTSISTTTTPSTTLTNVSRRTLFNFFGNRGNKQPAGSPKNPVLEEYLKRAPSKEKPSIQRGDLASSSIFDSERRVQERTTSDTTDSTETSIAGEKRAISNMSTVLDPVPRARERWQRKMVIREIQKGGRVTRAQFVKKTERESVAKSQNIKTSIKKLGPLARQIAGKTIEDAITQMRFSKKKAARDVLEHLEYARDAAVVERGMGLGGATREDGVAVAGGDKNLGSKEIQLKDGKRYTVTDPTQIYVDQAWVGRGPFGQLPDFRARGRVYIMRTPWTHFTVKLKEEATRVREYEEREDKRRRQRLDKVWMPLPDRPIQGQSQWYSW